MIRIRKMKSFMMIPGGSLKKELRSSESCNNTTSSGCSVNEIDDSN